MFKKFTLLIILTITLLIVLTSCGEKKKEYAPAAISEFNQGALYFEDWDKNASSRSRTEAIKHLEEAVEIEPFYAEAHLLLAKIFSKMVGEEENTRIYLDNAETAGSDNPETYLMLGDITKDENKAISYYEKSLDFASKSNNAEIVGYLGKRFEEMGKKEKAIEYYEKSIEIDKYCTLPYFQLIEIYEDANDIKNRNKYYIKGARLDISYFQKECDKLGINWKTVPKE